MLPLSLAMPWLPPTMPRLEAVSIGMPVLAVAALILVFTALLTGIWPALQVARWNVAAALRESLRGSSTTLHGGGIRDALVIGQVGIGLC